MAETEEPKQYLIARVREALAQDPRANELDVDVTVAAGKIFLTGTVATPERKAAISEVVRELCPNHEICNETTVADVSEPSEVEELS